MGTLIAEDLLLLLLDDETGSVSTSSTTRPLLGGAVLIELAIAGAVEVEERTSLLRRARVVAEDDAALEDPVLRRAYAAVAEKPRPADDLVNRLGKGLQEELCGRLEERGILQRREDKVLGLFPRTRWPAVDSSHEDDVRRALSAVLVQGAEPDERTGALVALLSAVNRAHTTVDHEGMSARDVRRRAKQIAEGAWAAKAVRDAVAASVAALTAVMGAGVVASGS